MNPKLKRGCGIGCALLFIVFMLLFGGTVYFSKQMGKEYKVVKELEEQLVEVHGASNQLPDGFTGVPSVERMEVFLAIRESSAEWRTMVETSFVKILAEEGLNEVDGFKHFLRILKASRDLAPVFSSFWTSRNQAMLDGGMGMGEYIYLYCLTYNSWLGYDPSDGARDAGAFLSGLGAAGPRVHPSEGDEEDVLDKMQHREWAWRQVNSLMLPLLQKAAREASAAGDASVLVWAEELQQEIQNLQDDPQRIPFTDNLPLHFGETCEPFRSRLEANYSVTVNPVELMFEDTWEDGE